MGTTDQSKLMFSIEMTDSLDSSSDDIIPMQSRRKKKTFNRKNRNVRPSSSSSFLKTNYSYDLCTLIKFLLMIAILISAIIGMVIVYSLSKRMDSLHLSISGLQSTNNDLHSLHMKYKTLEQESINLKINLNNVIITTSNLTQQTAQLNQKLNQFNEIAAFINSDINIKQLPNDVEQLKKIVESLQNKILNENSNKNDDDTKLSKEEKINLELRLNSFETKLQLMEQNLPTLFNQSMWNKQMEQMITVINNQMKILNGSLINITSIIDNISNNNINNNLTLHPTQVEQFTTLKPDLKSANSNVSSSNLSSDSTDHSTGHIIKKVLPIDNNNNNNNSSIQDASI